jgi:hypothetical protein
MRRITMTLVTAADGSATGYSPRCSGKVHSITYAKDGTIPYANGVGVTVTAEATGDAIWAEAAVNASANRHPRAPTHSTAGVAALYAAGGTAIQDPVAIANDRIKVVIASGGNAKSGVFHFLLAE